MTVRVLCTGDIHIGRRSSKVTGTYRSSAAWYAIVDIAISEAVDLLAISGDIIDKESKSYESIGPLQDGLARLAEAGIETVAVTGNHDHDVLVRLAGITGTDRFHLLGKGGTWERYTFHRDGEPALHVDGWSFPSAHVTDAPVRHYAASQDDDLPVLGLLHGDVGVPLSRYAPIHLNDLWAHPVDFWLLGHIHGSRTFTGPGSAIALYPGSPWALDPGEVGTHGVWMAEFGVGQQVSLTSMPISAVRYDTAPVDLSEVVDEAGFQQALSAALTGLGRTVIFEHGEGSLAVVSARLHCTGRCAAHWMVPSWIERARQNIGLFPVSSIEIEIDQITSDVRPPIELALLATGSDPAAETAKLILALESSVPNPIYDDLIHRTHQDMTSISGLTGYASLSVETEGRIDDGPTKDDARSLLSARAWDVLSALVANKEKA